MFSQMSSCGAVSLEEVISYLGLGNICVHWVFGFEDFLDLLLRTEKGSQKKDSYSLLGGRQGKIRGTRYYRMLSTTNTAIYTTYMNLNIFVLCMT